MHLQPCVPGCVLLTQRSICLAHVFLLAHLGTYFLPLSPTFSAPAAMCAMMSTADSALLAVPYVALHVSHFAFHLLPLHVLQPCVP
jgi:hypothetical protein